MQLYWLYVEYDPYVTQTNYRSLLCARCRKRPLDLRTFLESYPGSILKARAPRAENTYSLVVENRRAAFAAQMVLISRIPSLRRSALVAKVTRPAQPVYIKA